MLSLARFYHTTLGKKYVMAVTGLIWFLYLVVHMAANQLIYAGPASIDAYSHFLHAHPGLLWIARSILGVALVLHLVAAAQITLRNWGSRPVSYFLKHYREADYASRTMIWGGIIVILFVAYHLLDFTVGTVNPGFVEGRVYRNVVASFSVWWVSAIYIVAQAALALHLSHGLWSWFQTLGLSHPSYNACRRGFAIFFAAVVCLGFVMIPILVLSGVVR